MKLPPGPKWGRSRAASILAIGMLCLSLVSAGCGSEEPAPQALTIALAVFPAEASHYQRFVAEFEASHGIRVGLIAQSYSDILQVVLSQGGAGRGSLDVVELDLGMLARARDAVRDLSDIVTPSARRLFPAAAWRVAESGGRIRFVPHRLNWQAMIYNRLRVKHPPATWKELEAFARAHPGRFALKAARYEGLTCDVMPFVWGADGGQLAPDSPGSIRALSYLAGLAPFLEGRSPVLREMSALEAQARGSVWIHFNWPFAMTYLRSKGLAPEVDLSAPLPSGPDGVRTPLGGGYFAIPLSAPHPEAARAFLRYLLTAGAQRRLSRQLGWYGSVGPDPASPEALLYRGFTAMRERVRARAVIPCYAQLSGAWQRAARGVMFRGERPETALANVARSVAHIRALPPYGQSELCR